MSLRPFRRIAQAAVVVSLVAAGVGFAQFGKSVTLSVDGKPTAVHLFGSTVGDVLADQGINLGAHDVVTPAVSTPIDDNAKIVVRYGRLLTVTVDGQSKEFWTTATTVAGALSELGIRADSAKLSVSRSQPLGRTGLVMALTTPKNVAVAVDGKTWRRQTTSATVAGVLSELKVKLGAKDRIVPALKTPVPLGGLNVAVARVTQRNVTSSRAVGFGTQRRDDATLYTGTTKTVTAGTQGRMAHTNLVTWVNGKVESSKPIGIRVTTVPVARVIAVGTKSRPAPPPPPAPTQSAPARSAPARSAPAPSSSAGGSTVNGAMWDRIAKCESGGNWAINTGNGYYGGLQFDSQTWLGAGGGQFAGRADLASRTQQIAIANKIYADRGLQPWGCGWAA